MRIIHIVSSFPRFEDDGLLGVSVYELCKALVARGNIVHVICPHETGTKDEELMSGIHVHRVRYFRPERLCRLAYRSSMFYNIQSVPAQIQLPSLLMTMLLELLRSLKKEDFDVIHAHYVFPAGLIACLAATLVCHPIVVSEHGPFIYGAEAFSESPFLAKIGGRIARYVFRRSALIIANSSFTYRYVVSTFPEIKETSIVNIPLGVDLEAFSPRRSENRGRITIMTSGRLVPSKGFEYLIDAFRYVSKMYPNAELVVIGEGPVMPELKRRAQGLNIFFTGLVTRREMPSLLNKCDIFVLPSVAHEGLGRALIEGMACEKPVVGTKVGGIPDIVTPGRNGILVGPADSKALASAIIDLISDPARRDRMGREGRLIAQEKFDWNVIAERYERAYTQVMRGLT